MTSSERPLEDRLFQRYQRKRDPATLGELYDLVAPELLRVALHVTGDPAGAEDLLQSTLVTVMEAPERWDGQRPLRPWLLGVLRHHARNAQRLAQRRPDAQRLADPVSGAPLADAEREELKCALDAALERLPEDWRPVLVLRLHNGLSAAEIARALGRPPGTVRSQLARGIERLRNTLPASLAGALALVVGRPALGHAGLRAAIVERAATFRPLFPTTPWTFAMTTPQIVSAALVASSLGLFALVQTTRGVARADVEPLALASQPVLQAQHDISWTGARVPAGAPAGAPALDTNSSASVAAVVPVEGTLVRLRVLHEEDGRPARDACVLFSNSDDGLPYAQERVVYTDGDGRADVVDLAPGWVRARLLCGSQAHVRVWPGRAADVELAIPLGIHVDGEVVDALGRPVPGAAIWVSERWMRNAGRIVARADAAGRFALDGLTRDNFVGARSPVHAPSRLSVVRADPGQRDTLRIALIEPGYALSGIVVDELGAALAGAEVEVGGGGPALRTENGLGAPPAPPQRARTGADGRFAFSAVPAGDVPIFARAPGMATSATSVALDRRGSSDLVLELAAESVVVGTLHDHAGSPVPAASIRSGPYNHFTASATTSRFDGSFRLGGLAAGRAEILAEHLDFGRTRATLTLSAGEELRWDPVLDAVPTISGTLTDEQRQPLVGWTVIAHHDTLDATQWRFGPTRADGTFRIADLDPEQSYTLLVRDPGGAHAFPRRLVRGVRPSNEPYAIEVLEEDPELAAIAGTIVDAAGTAVPDAELTVWHEDMHLWHSTATDRGGAFAVRDVPPGRVRLEVRSNEHPWLRLGVRTLAAGERLDLETLALALGGRIVGRIETRDDASLETVAFALIDATGLEGGAIVREGRAFRSGPLTPGDYTLRITAEDAITVQRKLTIRAGLSEELWVELVPGASHHDRAEQSTQGG